MAATICPVLNTEGERLELPSSLRRSGVQDRALTIRGNPRKKFLAEDERLELPCSFPRLISSQVPHQLGESSKSGS